MFASKSIICRREMQSPDRYPKWNSWRGKTGGTTRGLYGRNLWRTGRTLGMQPHQWQHMGTVFSPSGENR